MGSLLIIFVKNPIVGKVKTRLAGTVGHAKALSVYKKLMEATRAITLDLPMAKQVAYSEFVPEHDLWDSEEYLKSRQAGKDLGERMQNAFYEAFEKGYRRVCLIGSDNYELNGGIIEKAYELLEDHDVVIGPASDGGYYLIGMTALYEDVFRRKQWGTHTVFSDTFDDLKRLSLSCALLPKLNDIDVLEDIREEDRDFLLS